MSSKQLKVWLKKRRESKVLERIREHLVHVNGCIVKLEDFLDSWEQKDKELATSIHLLIKEEEGIADNIENEIIDLLASGKTPEYVRADLLNFVRWADKAAGCIKRGTDNLLLLLDVNFSKNIKNLLRSISVALIEESKSFLDVFDNIFKLERDELLETIEKVADLESKIDKTYKQIKNEMVTNTSDIPAGALIVFDHAIRDMEESSDLIEDCAVLLRSIVLLQD